VSPRARTFGAVHDCLDAAHPTGSWSPWRWLGTLLRRWPLHPLMAWRASHAPARPRALGFAPTRYLTPDYQAFETDAAILWAIEQLTQVGLLEACGDTREDNAALALWCRDPQQLVARYLARHFAAEPGDALRWSTETLVYTPQGWQ
jgi:hypothetical protein